MEAGELGCIRRQSGVTSELGAEESLASLPSPDPAWRPFVGRRQLSPSQGMLRAWTLLAVYATVCGATVSGGRMLKVMLALSLSKCYSLSTYHFVLLLHPW